LISPMTTLIGFCTGVESPLPTMAEKEDKARPALQSEFRDDDAVMLAVNTLRAETSNLQTKMTVLERDNQDLRLIVKSFQSGISDKDPAFRAELQCLREDIADLRVRTDDFALEGEAIIVEDAPDNDEKTGTSLDVLLALDGAFGHEKKVRTLHDTTQQEFQEKVTVVILAEIMQTTFQEYVRLIVGRGNDNVDPDVELVVQTIYLSLITAIMPAVGWHLRKNLGESATGDSLKLVSRSCPVLIAWGLKSFVQQLQAVIAKHSGLHPGDDFWFEIGVAGCMTVFVWAVSRTQMFEQHTAAVAKGGATDTLFARYATIPASLGLTVGYCWNLVATFWITKWQGNVNSDLHFTEIQAVYSTCVFVGVKYATFKLTQYSVARQKKKKEMIEAGEAPSGFDNDVSVSVKVLTTILSFVYAWALLDILDDLFFTMLYGCRADRPTTASEHRVTATMDRLVKEAQTGASSSCSYQSNFIFSTISTMLFVGIVAFLKAGDPGDPMEATSIQLQVNAMTLTVSWAWMNFFLAILSQSTTTEEGWLVCVYFLADCDFWSWSCFLSLEAHAQPQCGTCTEASGQEPFGSKGSETRQNQKKGK